MSRAAIFEDRSPEMLFGLFVVVMLVVGCSTVTDTARVGPAPAPVGSLLVGTSWVVENIDRPGVLDPAQSTLNFESAGRISGRAACNRYFGTYEPGDDTMRLKPAGTTRMACEPAVMKQETKFLAELDAVTAFRREGNMLLLLDASGLVRLRLTPLAPVGGATATPPFRAHAFDCSGGPGILLVRAEGAGPGDAIDLVVSGGRRRLPRVPAASGEHYADGDISIRSNGREATLEIDGRSYACVENRRRSISEDARIRGVELRASGHEPGWIFELFPDRMAFVGGLGAERATTPRPSPQTSLAAGESVYAAATEAHRLTVRIRETGCVDPMSGERYEATVEVELDGKVYRGCGETLH